MQSQAATPDTFTTKLFAAIDKGNIENIKDLIAKGADLAATKGGRTPIQHARVLKKWDCVEAIATSKKTDAKDRIKDSFMYADPLIKCILADELSVEKKLDLVKKLLEAGASTNVGIDTDESCLLHCAVQKNIPALIELLIAHNTNLAYVNIKKQTAMHEAALRGYWKCVQTIAKLRDTDEKDTYQYGEALITAIEAGRPLHEIQQLVAAKASLAAKNEKGDTALHCAVRKGNSEVIRFLLANKAAQNTSHENKETTIELATRLGLLDIFQFHQQNNLIKTSIPLEKLAVDAKSFAQFSHDTNSLYQSLRDNEHKPQQLIVAIKKVDDRYKYILTIHKAKLIEYRDELNSKSLQTNIESDTEQLSALILTINTLLSNPDQQIDIAYQLNLDQPAENNLNSYLGYKKNLDNYLLRIKNFLVDIKNKLAHWEESFLGISINYRPTPLKKIYDLLENLTALSSTDDILNTYQKIILATANNDNDKSINDFYFYARKAMSAINFTPIYSATYNLQTMTITPPMQQTQMSAPPNYSYFQSMYQPNTWMTASYAPPHSFTNTTAYPSFSNLVPVHAYPQAYPSYQPPAVITDHPIPQNARVSSMNFISEAARNNRSATPSSLQNQAQETSEISNRGRSFNDS